MSGVFVGGADGDIGLALLVFVGYVPQPYDEMKNACVFSHRPYPFRWHRRLRPNTLGSPV